MNKKQKFNNLLFLAILSLAGTVLADDDASKAPDYSGNLTGDWGLAI